MPSVAHNHESACRLARSEWNTGAYLTEYYSRVEPTEELTLRFLSSALAELPAGGRALDVGAGPTLHHAIVLAGHVHEVHVADLMPQNLRAVRRWQIGAADAHDWSAFTRATLQLEGNRLPTDAEVAHREAMVRRRLTRVLLGDIRRQQVLGDLAETNYECVTSFFCADSVTANLGDWMRYVRNIIGMIAPDGLLVLAALRRCESWRIGNNRFPSPCIDEHHLQFVLDAAGFDRGRQSIQIGEVPDQLHNGFESIVLVSARAPQRAFVGSVRSETSTGTTAKTERSL